MKFNGIALLGGILLFVACQEESKSIGHEINNDRIGELTRDTKVSELDDVFKNDSVVNKNNNKRFSNGNEIVVYQKGGRELLRLRPKKSFDSTSTIANVEIIDTLYETEKGLKRGSDFKVVKENYSIKRIENTLGTAMVFLDDLNVYMDIDKKDISEPTRMGTRIKASQIRNSAKVKRIWLDWE